jgi:hypothetical protein
MKTCVIGRRKKDHKKRAQGTGAGGCTGESKTITEKRIPVS